jgi:serralysin
MSGLSSTYATFSKSTSVYANGVLSGMGWSGTITYAFPTETSDYSYTTETSNGFAAFNSTMQATALFALEQDDGNSADDGFSVEGFTQANIQLGSASSATIRMAQSNVPSTSYAYMPSSAAQGGDVWLGTHYDLTSPQAGNYAWHTILHEIGHALGLKHPHETSGAFGIMPSTYDDVEYSVMSYRAYVGAKLTGYTYSTWSAPQTYMMADIAALQHMYGADYTTNSGDTTYSWSPSSGDTYVDGVLAIDAGSSTIFATVWDGGGNDTYDLSAYSSALNINLAPGKSSAFSSDQLATLGVGKHAVGNIYNALLYHDNTASMIENAIGGSGNDLINGNTISNSLHGGAGADKIYGLDAADTLNGDAGNDYLDGGTGNDTIFGGTDADTITGGIGNDILYGGDGNDNITDLLGNTTVYGGTGDDYIKTGTGIDVISGDEGADTIYGGAGNDTIHGGADDDKIYGEAGNNLLFGDAGNDSIVGNIGADTIWGGDGADYIIGSTGNDMLYGEAGSDTITGGGGNDTISGGGDADVFLFESATTMGRDVITDFDVTMDELKFGVSTMASLVISAAKQVGDNVVITFSSTATLTLDHFSLADVHDILIAA